MTIHPRDFMLPPDYDKPLTNRYYDKIRSHTSEFISCYEPCHNCICLAMCLNKFPYHILHCPIVINLFYWQALSIPVHTSIVIDIKSFDLLFWIIRVNHVDATVELVVDDVIQFMSISINLNDGRVWSTS